MNESSVQYGIEPLASRTVFLGGIPLVSTKKMLVDYLSKFDIVEKIEMPRYSDSNVLKGYAKAIVASSMGVQRLISSNPHFIGGLEIGILRWQDTNSYLRKKNNESKRKVYLRIPFNFNEDLLYNYFIKFGNIDNIDLKTQPITNKRRDFCYITFVDSFTAKEVIDRNPHRVRGHQIFCEPSIRPTSTIRESIMQKRVQMGIFDTPSTFPNNESNKYANKDCSKRVGIPLSGNSKLAYSNTGKKDCEEESHILQSPKVKEKISVSAQYEEAKKPEYNQAVDWNMAHFKPVSNNYPKLIREILENNHKDLSNLCFSLKICK